MKIATNKYIIVECDATYVVYWKCFVDSHDSFLNKS